MIKRNLERLSFKILYDSFMIEGKTIFIRFFGAPYGIWLDHLISTCYKIRGKHFSRHVSLEILMEITIQ